MLRTYACLVTGSASCLRPEEQADTERRLQMGPQGSAVVLKNTLIPHTFSVTGGGTGLWEGGLLHSELFS